MSLLLVPVNGDAIRRHLIVMRHHHRHSRQHHNSCQISELTVFISNVIFISVYFDVCFCGEGRGCTGIYFHIIIYPSNHIILCVGFEQQDRTAVCIARCASSLSLTKVQSPDNFIGSISRIHKLPRLHSGVALWQCGGIPDPI